MSSLEQVQQLLQEAMQEIDDSHLYFSCKKYGLKRIDVNRKTFKILKAIISFHELGFTRVTADMVHFALKLEKSDMTVWKRLHLLGDYNVLIKDRGKKLSWWRLHPAFLKVYRGE